MAKPLTQARTPLLVLAVLRAGLAVLAIPLAPFLYREHFAVLVLLRPTKEVLLAGGFLAKEGDVSLPVVLAAAFPLAVFGVWLLYAVGQAYAEEITTGKGLPRLVQRLFPKERIEALTEVLEKKGPKVIVLGRLAAFPSALLAAAAGASGLEARRFLPADLAGALASFAVVLTVGYLLGDAYEDAGPWITGAGLLVLVALLVLIGRAIRRI